MIMKTFQPKVKDIKRNWHFVDAEGQVLGRLATKVAGLLMSKHKVDYVAHLDMGDFVVVVNATGIKLTGRKEKQKVYYKHSGFPGGFKEISFEKMKREHPERVIEIAVRGMLPGNRLRSKRMRRLMVFKGAKHPHEEKFENGEKK